MLERETSLKGAPAGECPVTAPPPLSRLRKWIPVAAIAGLAGVAVVATTQKLPILEMVIDGRDRYSALVAHHPGLALAMYMLAYVAAVTVSLPGATLLTLAGGLLFGWLAGGLAAVIAATLGATIVFAIAKTAIGESLVRRAGPQVARLRAGFCENALSYMLFLRLVPAFPFFIVNIVPAVIGVPLRTYVVGTFLGILPGTFAFSFIGAGLDGVVAAAKVKQAACRADDAAAACPLHFDVSSVFRMEFRLALALLGLLALAPVAAKFWRQRYGRARA